ncbi:MAG TPA: hypothetical protein VIG74_05575 [Alphaproteobacteria bacterium]
MKRTFMMIGLTALLFSRTAHAFCTTPRADQGLAAPQPPGTYDKPREPECLSRGGYGGAGDCDGRQIDDYRLAMDQYAEQLEEFARRAEEFSDKAAASPKRPRNIANARRGNRSGANLSNCCCV